MAEIPEPLRAILADHYRVERELGRGGMAIVWLAEDLKHGRRVAIKVLNPELSAALGADRFHREIEVAARLQHPHILTLLDSGAAGGLLYYVMPFVAGESLRARLAREHQLPVEEAVRLVGEVARALDYAHRQGIVHRDVKPENILLADGQAVLSDFGIARAIHAAGGGSLTATGTTLGTPPYMSPEQVVGSADLDGRSDLYSLGCVLYEMLAGQPPFTGPAETLPHQHLSVSPRLVSELRPAVPALLAKAMDRALAKTPADRFATGQQFAEALGGTPLGLAVTSPPDRDAHRRRRVRRTVAGFAVAGLILAVAAVGLWSGAFVRRSPLGTATPDAGHQWLWLAEFEGPAADPSLLAAARELVGATLDQSDLIATVPREQERIALRNAGRPDTTRIDATLAHELAYRSAIRAVVEGRVSRLSEGYSILLRVTEAEDGRTLLSANATAGHERDLMSALTRVARELRRGLGERPALMRPTESFSPAPTPSFEAFKLYAKGRSLVQDGRPEAGLPLLKHAVALDPGFATAWAAIGAAFLNMGQTDSAMAAHREALRHPERLSEHRRLSLVAVIARQEHDWRTAIESYEAALRLKLSPGDAASMLNNQAIVLAELGRYETALALFRRAAEGRPIEPPQVNYFGIGDMLLALGRADEAGRLLPKLRERFGPWLALEVALEQRDWPRAESLSIAAETDPARPLWARMLAGTGHASVLAARGELRPAAQVLARCQDAAAAEHEWDWVAVGWWNRAWLETLAGREIPAVPGVATGAPAIAMRSLRAALLDDTLQARVALARWDDADPPETRAAVAAQIEGWRETRRGNWVAVVEGLAPAARGGTRRGTALVELLRTPSRWLVAQAFAETGRPDSAAVYLELMLEPPGYPSNVLHSRGLSEPFVRARLAVLYAVMGRGDDARRHRQALGETCSRPEPELRAWLAAEGSRPTPHRPPAIEAANR